MDEWMEEAISDLRSLNRRSQILKKKSTALVIRSRLLLANTEIHFELLNRMLETEANT